MDMRRDSFSRWTGVGVAAIAVVAVAILIARPWDSYTKYECKYCHAQQTRHWIFFIQLPGAVHEGRLCRYWRSSVDPHHKHAFQMMSEWNAGLDRSTGDSNEYGLLAWTDQREKRDVAILRSLPTPAARKAIVEECLRSSCVEWDCTIGKYMATASHTKP